MGKAVFIGHNALGDTLCTTPVVRAFRRAHPAATIFYVVQSAGFCRVLDGNPDIDLVIYSETLYLYGMTRFSREWLQSLPLDLQEPATLYHFDIRQVCSTAEAFREHISAGFSKLLQVPIDSVRPVVALNEAERRAARLYTPRPYVVFSMHSVANPERPDGRGRAKEWPVERWAALAERIGRWGFDVIAVGAEKEPQPLLPGVRNLYGLPIKVAAALLEGSEAVITIENGLAHLAAAVDAPAVELYSNVVPREWAWPAESTRCQVLYGDPLAMTLDEVAAAAESVMGAATARV